MMMYPGHGCPYQEQQPWSSGMHETRQLTVVLDTSNQPSIAIGMLMTGSVSFLEKKNYMISVLQWHGLRPSEGKEATVQLVLVLF
jgi:hypothetical protein